MKSQSYKGLFEDWEVGVAKKVIEMFRNDWKCLALQDFDDLLQECLIHWYFAKNKYDSSLKASKKTFMARIVRNKLRDLVRVLNRQKRKVAQESISLNESISDEEDAPTFLDALLEKKDTEGICLRGELKIIISKVSESLTLQQRKICELISENDPNITSIAHVLNIDRTTVYREIKRIRSMFEKEGLKDYLKLPATLSGKTAYVRLEGEDDG